MGREGHNKPSTGRKQPDQRASGGDALDDFTKLEGHSEHEYRLRNEHSMRGGGMGQTGLDLNLCSATELIAEYIKWY